MTIISDDRTHKDRTIVMPADWVPGPRQGSWTYEAYTALPEDGSRYEIVQGVLMMTPAPEPAHQGIAEEINSYLRSQKKRIVGAPDLNLAHCARNKNYCKPAF